MCGRAQCITTAPFDGHHPTDKIQRISGPPGGPEIRRQHRRRSQRRIWGQELAPSRPQPPTGGTDGIQPAAGSPTTPGWCRPAHARAGGWCWVWCTEARHKPYRRRPAVGRPPPDTSRGRTELRTADPAAEFCEEKRFSNHSSRQDRPGPVMSSSGGSGFKNKAGRPKGHRECLDYEMTRRCGPCRRKPKPDNTYRSKCQGVRPAGGPEPEPPIPLADRVRERTNRSASRMAAVNQMSGMSRSRSSGIGSWRSSDISSNHFPVSGRPAIWRTASH